MKEVGVVKVNHINIPDSKANIFCKRINSIIHLDKDGSFWDNCSNCPMLNGSAQGEGVECLWDDPDETSPVVYCYNPKEEMLRVVKN